MSIKWWVIASSRSIIRSTRWSDKSSPVLTNQVFKCNLESSRITKYQSCSHPHGHKKDSNPTNTFMCVSEWIEKELSHQVSRCCTRGQSEESIAYRWWSLQARGSTLALNPRADVTRSPEQGYQSPNKKDKCPQNPNSYIMVPDIIGVFS